MGVEGVVGEGVVVVASIGAEGVVLEGVVVVASIGVEAVTPNQKEIS